jgi:hypothetical protein
MNHYISANTNSYYIMARISFIIAFVGGLTGVWLLEGTLAIKEFLAMTFVFMISSCFTLVVSQANSVGYIFSVILV